MPESKMDIVMRLAELHRQATTENSHYYTASVIHDAIHEILALRMAIHGYKLNAETKTRKKQ